MPNSRSSDRTFINGTSRLPAGRLVLAAFGLVVSAQFFWEYLPPHSLAANEGGAAPAPAPRTDAAAWRLVGVGSCVSAGCHGDANPHTIQGSEYNIWISADPHAEAYSVLFDERSLRMVRLVAGNTGNAVPPHQDKRCLACHSMTHAPPRDPRRDVLTDGVGCEACHGPAEGWLAPHTRPSADQQQLAKLGLWDTDKLATRAQICASCHVGGPGRDVDHDLIAAGHPRLEFELGAYLDAMPKHWDDNQERAAAGPDFEARLWIIGQLRNSQAALAQLAARADAGRSWPELAEWSCSACHHDLEGGEERQLRLAEQGGLSGRRFTWESWNHFTTQFHAADVSRAFGLDANAATQIESQLQLLRREMQSFDPDRRQVALLAHSTADTIDVWADMIDSAAVDHSRYQELASQILVRQREVGELDWSTSAQIYAALASLHGAELQRVAGRQPDQSPSQQSLTLAIQRLFEELVANRPPRSTFRPDQVRRYLDEIDRLLSSDASVR